MILVRPSFVAKKRTPKTPAFLLCYWMSGDKSFCQFFFQSGGWLAEVYDQGKGVILLRNIEITIVHRNDILNALKTKAVEFFFFGGGLWKIAFCL